MILGGMVLPNGQPAGVAGALVSPGAAGETRIGIETASEGSGLARVDTAALHLVQPSFAGATGPDFAPTGENTPVRIEAVRSTLLNAQSECVDNYSVSLKALNALRLIAMGEGGSELAWLLVQRTSEGQHHLHRRRVFCLGRCPNTVEFRADDSLEHADRGEHSVQCNGTALHAGLENHLG